MRGVEDFARLVPGSVMAVHAALGALRDGELARVNGAQGVVSRIG